MAQLGATFDANAVEPNAPFEILPAGKYKAHIVGSEMRSTKNGSGQYLWLELEILDGEFQGRKTWDRLNLINDNEKAAQIAQRTLSAICHATGKLQISDSEELHFLPLMITVNVRPERGEYAASNEVKGYEANTGSSAPKPQPAKAQAVTPAPVKATAAPPWKKTA